MLPALVKQDSFPKSLPSGFRWNWIINPKSDLVWFIGSTLVGWFYLGLILYIGRDLADPLRDPFYTMTLGDHSLRLTLELLVFASWAYLVDSPHLWATISRTYLDPDEWSARRRELLFAFVWFGAGPAALLLPYLLAVWIPMEADAMALGGQLFFAFFRLWAYYHVVRQHWGFLLIYQRKNGDHSDPFERRADFWFFHLALYLPLLLFVTSARGPGSGFADVEIPGVVIGSWPVAGVVRQVAIWLYVATAAAYLSFQWQRWRQGVARNGPKLFFLLSIVPLHCVVFWHPLAALFAVPIVTVGHNLQYHRIVWMYGRNKYLRDTTGRYRWARPVFSHLWLYAALGGAFTFLWSRGPWVEFVGEAASRSFDQWIFPAIGMMAGLTDPSSAGVGAEVVALFLTGWSMHHYYLDSKIWRVSSDRGVAKSLNL